jgi:agmatinase
MIDPMRRWRHVAEKPDYAGLLTFAGVPYTEDPAELVDADVAIVGAPMDELVCERPGTRLGPRAIRAASTMPGAHLTAGVDAMTRLRVVDYGDAAVLPADPRASHAAIAEIVGEVLGAGALPVVLGGDHSIAEPEIRAVAAAHGPVGVVHFDAHTDTGTECFGVGLSHGTPFRTLVDHGLVDPCRYAQIGLRGYWPGEDTFAWQRERGITSLFMHDVTARGIATVLDEAIAAVGSGPVVLTVDVDALDPAYAPGTGTPEPGGMTSVDLLWACREVATRCELVAADVVEVCPTEIGAADITALVGSRLVHEILTGLALARATTGAPGDVPAPGARVAPAGWG